MWRGPATAALLKMECLGLAAPGLLGARGVHNEVYVAGAAATSRWERVAAAAQAVWRRAPPGSSQAQGADGAWRFTSSSSPPRFCRRQPWVHAAASWRAREHLDDELATALHSISWWRCINATSSYGTALIRHNGMCMVFMYHGTQERDGADGCGVEPVFYSARAGSMPSCYGCGEAKIPTSPMTICGVDLLRPAGCYAPTHTCDLSHPSTPPTPRKLRWNAV